MRLRAAWKLLGACLLASASLNSGFAPASASESSSTGPDQLVVLELGEPVSVSDAVRLAGSVDTQPAEFITRYRVGGQISTAGYTIDAARRSVSAAAVTKGLRTVVAGAIGKIRENEHLSTSTKARWVKDHTAAVSALDSGHPAIHRIMVHASDSATQRLRTQKVVESAVIVPATKPKSSTASPKTSAASNAPGATAAATAGGVPWWPYTGFIETNCCTETGDRFVYQAMVWTGARLNALKNATGDPSNVGYEPDATYWNGDNGIYLGDTISWTTNLPSPYLDSQFGDPQERKIRTVGSADVRPMVLNGSDPVTGAPEATYFTVIASEDGTASTDTAGVQGTVVFRVPPSCYLAACQFPNGVPTHTFIGLYNHQAPGLTEYPCEAAIEGHCDPSLDGPPVLLSVELGGQQRSFSFQGTIGALISLGLTDNTFSQRVTIAVLKPDGTQLASTSLSGPVGSLDLPKLPIAGTYQVRLTPSASDVGWVTVTLSTALTGLMTVDGAVATVTISRSAQDAYIDFQGTANQQLSLALTSKTFTDGLPVYILKPDGTTLTSTTAHGAASQLDLPKLPANGTYRIRLNPGMGGTGLGTGNVALTLSTPVIAGSMVVDGATKSVTIPRPAQDAYIDFQGTANQQLSLALTSKTFTDGLPVYILKPDGTTLTSTITHGSVDQLDLPKLPASGTYRIRLDPGMGGTGLGTGSVNLTLSTLVTGSMAVNGAAKSVTIPRPAQDAYIDFQGTANQQLSLALTSKTFTDGLPVDILKPDGTTLTSTTAHGSVDQLDLPKLPTSGTYRIRLNPGMGGTGLGTGSVNLTLSTVVTGSISVGSSTAMTTTRPAQDAYIDFQGTAGQLLRVGLSFNTMADSIAVTVYNPSGTTLKSGTVGVTGSIDVPALPTSGTYRIRLNPGMTPNLGQGTVSVSLSNR